MSGLERDQWGRYSWNGGGPIPGATTILKLQDVLIGGDLASWGATKAVDAIVDHRLPYDDPTAIRRLAMRQVVAARDRGTKVHAAIEQILAGRQAEPTPETAPYIYAFSSFLAAERPEFLAVEQRIVNLREHYAGTFDFIAKMRGRIALVDVKSGKFKVSMRLQLAAYSAADGIGFEGDPEIHPLPRIRDHYILLLSPDGYELVEMAVTREDRAHFIALARTYHRMRAWQDRQSALMEEAA
jgi:hypothetical protein